MHALINKTTHSYGRSTMTVGQLVATLAEQNISVAAITDLHTLSGVPEFLLSCERKGIHGIAGITLNVLRGDSFCGELTLLAKGDHGYQSLLALLDEAKHISLSREFSPNMGIQLDLLLSGHFQELLVNTVCLDGYPGSVGEYLCKELPAPSLETIILAYTDSDQPLHQLRTQFLQGDYWGTQLAQRRSVVAYAMDDERLKRSIQPCSVQTSIAHAKNARELLASKQLFAEYAKNWLSQFPEGEKFSYVQRMYKDKTLDVGPRETPSAMFINAAQVVNALPTPAFAYKSKPVSGLIVSGYQADEPGLSDLMNQAWPDFKKTLSEHEIQTYRQQVHHELSVIKSLGFENYFLNIYKIKRMSDSIPGSAVMLRGSAVGSLVMHILQLSPVDPIKNGLLFARFLSEHRQEEPDVDMEFVDPEKIRKSLPNSFDNRQGAVNPQFVYLSDDNGIANAFEMLMMANRAVENFVALSEAQKKSYQRAFDILSSFAYVRGTKNFHPYGKKRSWEEQEPELRRILAKMPSFTELSALVDVASAISRGMWSSKVSAASIAIIPEGAGHYFNLLPAFENAPSDELKRIPMSKSSLPATGFIKYDILFNHSFKRTMHGMAMAGIDPNIRISNNDPVIGYLFKKKAFLGVCQLNAYAGDRLAQQMMPTCYEDLTALFALIRDASGKENNEVIDAYLRNKSNPDGLVLPDAVAPILKETHGALLYEEQLMRLLTDIGGFSWTEADRFRSSLKKGKYEVIAEYEPGFVSHVQEKFGLTKEEAEPWYQPLRDKSGRFVFSKAHAVAYAHLAVQQCYLKCKYPAIYNAELYLDKKFTLKGSKVSLKEILENWSMQLIKSELNGVKVFHTSPQSMIDFVDAVCEIIHRERLNPDTSYKVKDINVLRSEIAQVAPGLAAMGLAPDNMPSEKLTALLLSRFDKNLIGLVDAPQKNAPAVSGARMLTNSKKTERTNEPSAALTTENMKFSDDSIAQTLSEDAQPLNQTKAVNLAKEVMIGHFLWFMAKSGYITYPAVNTDKSASNDHFRFSATSADGKLINYHLSAPSIDPVRAAKRPAGRSATSGCFQGGERNSVGINSVEHLMLFFCYDKIIPGAPEVKEIPSNKESHKLRYAIGNIAPFLKEMVQTSKVPLYGLNALKSEFSAQAITDPLHSIFYARTASEVNRLKPLLKETLIDGRGFDPEHFQHLFDNQSLMFGTKFGKLLPSKRGGNPYRMESKNIFAQFRLPDGKTPLWDLPMPKDGEFASGGHQSIFWSSEKKKVSRPDHATNRILGHFYGDPKEGSRILWVAEGIFDAMAFNELQRTLPAVKGDVPWAEPNSISIKSAGGAVRFLNKVLNIQLEFIKNGDDVMVDFIENNHEVELSKLPEQYVNMLSSWIKDRAVHWVDDAAKPEHTKMIMAMIRLAKLSADDLQRCFKIHRAADGKSQSVMRDVYKNKMTSESDVLLHAGNLEQWMSMNSMKFIKSSGGAGEYELYLMQDKKPENSIKFSQMREDQQEELAHTLRNRFREMTGAIALGSALDGDHAGLVETAQLELFAKKIGLPFATFIPQVRNIKHPKTGESIELKDHNDYLNMIRRFQRERLFDPLFHLLQDYHEACKVPDRRLLLSPQKSRQRPAELEQKQAIDAKKSISRTG